MTPFHPSDAAVEAAARALFRRLRIDMGIKGHWRSMTPDDKEAFRDDVRLVVREVVRVDQPSELDRLVAVLADKAMNE